jgi:hypothetical protein
MKSGKRLFECLITSVAIAGLVLALPVSAWADGMGLPPAGAPEQWAQLEEGQQIAVVTLGRENAAHIDLFVSMLDRTGETHEVVFLLPLGMDSSGFEVTEETSLQFDEAVTEELDQILLRDAEQTASYRRGLDYALLSGTLFINGAWTWPFWILWSLVACAPGAEVVPLATYETESSQVAIYGVDRDVDLATFLEATGLDPVVKDTLARLQGQQIAVVRLQTQPRPSQTSQGGAERTGQPGIHLSWTTALLAQSAAAESRHLSGGTTYAYPLGTGSAWAHPIEWTRVYVVAPPGVDFGIQYPQLGPDQSGYVAPFLGATKPRIQDARGPAHAVENAVGDFGRVWRATYMHSNSSEDVIITLLPQMSAETLGALQRLEQRVVLQAVAYGVSILVAVLLWLVVWRYTMPRLLDITYTWREFTLYRHALGWALLYPLTNGVLFGLALVLVPLTAGVSILVGAPLLLTTLLGTVSLALFTHWSLNTLKVSPGRAVRAYILVALVSNALYVVFVLACRKLLGLG